MRELLPELPLVVVSEFQPPDVEWIPYHLKRSAEENLALVRARLGLRRVRLSAMILEPRTPYRKLRWMAFRLAPFECLAFNENMDHFMLRPGSVGTMLRHGVWRAKNFARVQSRPHGFAYKWVERLRHPAKMRRPILFRLALLAGRVTWMLKAGSPKAMAPAASVAAREAGISVVIPSRNGRELLAALLPGVEADLQGLRAQVIVVDNGSDDGSADFLRAQFPGVAVESSIAPLSFARAVNRGIRRAQLSHVCLLNNDMLVEAGFFAALRGAFERVPDLFCATAQIFLPEGLRREETGKAAFPLIRPREGFPVHCEVPVDGEADTYVLYGSGGCSLYDGAKLAALGNVAEVFDPAYVEDLDLGFRAWRLNWPSVYVGGARVLHNHRTTTSRYYGERELTRVLEVNFLKFLARAVTDRTLFRQLWSEAIRRVNLTAMDGDVYTDVMQAALIAPGWIESQPVARLPEREILALGSGDVAVFPGLAPSGKPKVLIVSPYVPFPLAHGGAVRMYNLMRRGAHQMDQILICFSDSLQLVPPEILAICVEVIYVRRAGSHALPDAGRPEVVEEFDSPVFHAALRQTVRKWKPAIAQLEFTQMAQYAADCAPARTMLVEHDITLDLYAQLLEQRNDWETRRQYERWVRFEQYAWGKIDRVVTMSEKDRRAVGRVHAIALPNGVDVQRYAPTGVAPERARILFIGSFAHLPNVLALDFFLREAWPALAHLQPTLHVIAGSRPEYFLDRYKDRVVLSLAQAGVEVEGFVSDVRPAYERAMVVVAPLLASAGTNIKIMEAMAMGKAIVSTPAGINGLHEIEDGKDLLVASTGAEIAAAIESLCTDAELRERLERQAHHTAVEKFDWDVIAGKQAAIYEALLAL